MAKPHTKVVGRRDLPDRVSAEEAAGRQDTVIAELGGRVLCPRGVFRFRSFEEADEWLAYHSARLARAHRGERT